VGRVVVYLLYVLLISGGPPAFAQNQRSADSTISPYLLRVQRKTPRSAICVLLRQNGQFHMETTSRDRTKVLEGSLRSSELRKVHHMLDSGAIPWLSQDKPLPTETTRVSQIVQVSIFRTDHWQNLVFMDENGSQTVPRALGPLLNWVGSLDKQPHRQLKEDDSKNNCQSPKKIELQERP
jgi:hypothetical protein